MIGKDQLNTIEVLIFQELIDSYISHDKFLSVNNVLIEYYEIKKEIKNLELLWNVLYKSKENLMCQLQKTDCSWKFKCQKTKQNRLMLLLNYAVSDKKIKFY